MRNMLVVFLWFISFCVIMVGGYAALDHLTMRISNFFATIMQPQTTQKMRLANPPKDATMDEGETDAPAPGGNAEAEEEPLISSTTTGASEEFDCTKTLNRPLTWFEKKLARHARKIALNNGWNYAPLEEAGKIGTHAMTVVVKGREAPSDLAGIYYRDKPLEEWEKQLARTLLDLARENGSEDQSEKK